ncbi:MAG TPA: tetratricopeptide repeat protein [Opitutaceae bacterium]|nr:tetratricopeptide repeat protein [Opitutaceae bacterium]
MANSAPSDPNVPAKTPKGSEAPSTPAEPPFEETLRQFWQKNAKSIYAVCIVVLLAIIGRGGYEYYLRQQEAGVEAEFAAATSPEKMKSFIAEHPKHSLAGVASLNLADAAYANSNYTDAIVNYQRAAEIFKTGPFAGRARLGVAISKLNGGNKAEGEEALKQLANDNSQLKPVRSEAAYHAATLALEAGRTEDAAKFAELATTVDQTGIWAQRAMMLRATLPAPAASAAANDATIKLLPSKP